MSAEGSFVEDAIHYMLNAVSKEDLNLLLSKDEEWQRFVTDTELSRKEAQEIREGLKTQKTASGTEFKEMPHQRLGFRERFLKLYPQVKEALETLIAQLRALATRADQVHRGATISNLVANTTGLVSGILTIVGVGLTPITAGVSLALTTTGLGLGTLAAATSATTTIVESTKESAIAAEANSLAPFWSQTLDWVLQLVKNSTSRVPSVINSYNHWNRVVRHIRAMRGAQGFGPVTGITAESGNLVGNVLRNISRGMSMGEKICFGVNEGLSLFVDICNIVHESYDLLSGAKTESAENLRRRALVLEKLLEELKQVHGRLQ